jgi:hypothetical protein
MSGTIRITQTVEGKSVTIPGVLLVSWPGSLRLELQDPVGSVLALLLVEGDRFWLYQQNRKENLTGPIAKLPTGLSLPFVAEDLVRVILARPDLEKFRLVPAEGNRAELAKGLEALSWSEGRFQIQEWMKKIPGAPMSRANYEEYASKSGALYPTKLRLTSGVGEKSERSALVVWVDWEPKVYDKKNFQIPPSRDFGRKTKALP